MLKLEEELKVYLYTEATDMRRGFDRLAEMARAQIEKNPLEGGLFVFFGRRRDRVKILFWDCDGYCIWYKRLEAGTFRIDERDGCEEITGVDLKLLLQGMSLKRIKLRKKVEEGMFSQEAA